MLKIACFTFQIIILCMFTACPTNPSPTETVNKNTAQTAVENAFSLDDALRRSFPILSKDLEAGSVIAIINISSADPIEEEFAIEELIILFVNSKKFKIVDRRSLDIIRAEQFFQLSGEVDDATAVAVGHLIGAQTVITGSISGNKEAHYLRLKALDVETGQITAVSSQKY